MLATITGTGDGTAPVVALTFPFLDKSHVKVTVDGVAVAFTWTGASQITLSAAVPVGSTWKVYRDTPTTNPLLVDFTNGATLTEADLDKANLAHVYRDDEITDLHSQTVADVAAEKTARIDADAQLTAAIAAVPKGDPGGNIMAIGPFIAGSTLTVPAGTNLVRTSGHTTEGLGAADYIADAAVDAAYVTANPKTSFITANGRGFRLSLDQQLRLSHFGAVGDDVTDDTAAVQTAINVASAAGKVLFVPAPEVAYKLTAPVNITKSLRVRGEGLSPYVGALGTRGDGSWFHLAHLGKGFVIDNAGGLMGGIELSHIGTFRDQPAPGPGWAPIAADFDIDITDSDVLVNDVMLLNPTKGVHLTQGNAGRLTVNRLRGQPMSVGLFLEDSYDGAVINDVRWWPFWSNDANVNAYTMANRAGIKLGHVDNPSIKGFFDIYSRFPLYFTAHINGPVSRGNIIAPEFDQFGETAVYVEAGANTTTIQVVGGYAVGSNDGSAFQQAIDVEADNCELMFTGFRVSNVQARAATINGTGNTLVVNGPYVNDWNVANLNHEAFGAAAGNAIFLNGKGLYTGGNGEAKLNNPTLVSSDEWLSSNPAPTATTGTLTSGSATLHYKRYAETVEFELTVNVTTNGTGDGAIEVPLPVSAAGDASAIGREVALTGKAIVATITGANILLQNYDNTYPGANGAKLVVSGQYRTA